jgi:hypothetical protein
MNAQNQMFTNRLFFHKPMTIERPGTSRLARESYSKSDFVHIDGVEGECAVLVREFPAVAGLDSYTTTWTDDIWMCALAL